MIQSPHRCNKGTCAHAPPMFVNTWRKTKAEWVSGPTVQFPDSTRVAEKAICLTCFFCLSLCTSVFCFSSLDVCTCFLETICLRVHADVTCIYTFEWNGNTEVWRWLYSVCVTVFFHISTYPCRSISQMCHDNVPFIFTCRQKHCARVMRPVYFTWKVYNMCGQKRRPNFFFFSKSYQREKYNQRHWS